MGRSGVRVRIRVQAWATIAIIAVGVAACSDATPDPPPTASAAPEPGDAPNILFVLVDDQAPDTLGFEGNAVIRTPHLDRLAREGTYFSRAYVPLPQCAPSRAAILTGRYPHEAGVLSNLDAELDPALPTLATRLADRDYRRGFIGKWHLGSPERPQAGFDDFWIALDPSATGHEKYFDPPLWVDGESVEHEGFLTRILTDYAISFIDEDDTRPFFLWLAYKAPHYPYVRASSGSPRYPPSAVRLPASAEDDLATKPRAQRESHSHRWFLESGDYGVRSETSRYFEMVGVLDDQIGRLLTHLEMRGIQRNTLIVYFSDNGVFLGEHQMLAKGPAFYEELVRVPLIFHWPGVVPAGEVRDDLVSSLDLLPTLLGVAGGGGTPAGSGFDIWPLVLGRGTPVRDAIYFEYSVKGLGGEPEPMLGVATARHKYARYLANGDEELYDLAADPDEMNNLAGSDVQSRELERLRARVETFKQSIATPFWP